VVVRRAGQRADPADVPEPRRAYANSGVVFGVILARLMLFSEAEFKFQRLADKSLFGNRICEAGAPVAGGTTGELLARMEQDVSLAGNAYIRDAGTQLERLRPDWVTIVSEVVYDPEDGHRDPPGHRLHYDPHRPTRTATTRSTRSTRWRTGRRSPTRWRTSAACRG
jgi:hypothetical protein